MMRRTILAILLAFMPGIAMAQVKQSGSMTPGHAVRWTAQGVISDGGGAGGSQILGSNYLTELGITNTGTPLGINDSLISGGYHSLTFGANALGGGLINYQANGGALTLPLQICANGACQTFPFAGTAPTLPVNDPRTYGAVCNTGVDSTSGIQQAVNNAGVSGGWVIIPCPMTIAGKVTIPGAVRLMGMGPSGYPGQNSGQNVWPPTKGPAINCTGTGDFCIQADGSGVEIDHINFGNPQPTPPASGTWSPTVYPFVIGTITTSGWQSLFLHDLTFTSTSHAIDLEGTPDYAAYSGSQITISHIWCNACLNTGIRIHRIDNPLFIDHVEFTPAWNFSVASMGAYQRANLIGFDIAYAAAPQFANIDFFSTKSALQINNDTVTNNFGHLTFAISAAQFTNTMFNQVCQAMTMPGGNGTIAEFYFTNTYLWGDQSGFQCAKGLPLISAPSNDVRLFMYNTGVNIADTFANIGCGVPGTGSCPASTPGGGAFTRFDGLRADSYSAFSAGQPFMRVPAGTEVYFGSTYVGDIVPASGGGNIMAPGPDGSQGYASLLNVGGGANNIEGSATLTGGTNTGGSGFATFFTLDHNEAGWVGGCNSATPKGCSLASTIGSLYLKPNYPASGTTMSFGATGGTSIVNLGTLPTSCSGQVTGTLWVNAGAINSCP